MLWYEVELSVGLMSQFPDMVARARIVKMLQATLEHCPESRRRKERSGDPDVEQVPQLDTDRLATGGYTQAAHAQDLTVN